MLLRVYGEECDGCLQLGWGACPIRSSGTKLPLWSKTGRAVAWVDVNFFSSPCPSSFAPVKWKCKVFHRSFRAGVIAKLINAAIAALDPFNVCHGGVLPLACWNNTLTIPLVLYDEDLCIMLARLLFWCMAFVSRWSNRLTVRPWVHLKNLSSSSEPLTFPYDEVQRCCVASVASGGKWKLKFLVQEQRCSNSTIHHVIWFSNWSR